jgi:hypothetical protein
VACAIVSGAGLLSRVAPAANSSTSALSRAAFAPPSADGPAALGVLTPAERNPLDGHHADDHGDPHEHDQKPLIKTPAARMLLMALDLGRLVMNALVAHGLAHCSSGSLRGLFRCIHRPSLLPESAARRLACSLRLRLR